MNAITVIGFIMWSGVGVWLLYGERELIRLGRASCKWARVEGTIVDSYDDSFTTPGIDNMDAGIVEVTNKETAHVYEYQVDGRTYRCNTFCFGGSIDRAPAAYAIGTKVTVHYDPKHPEVAVLRPGLQFGAVIGIFPIGAAFLWLLFRL